MYRQIAQALKNKHVPLLLTGIESNTFGKNAFLDKEDYSGSPLPFDLNYFLSCKLPTVHNGFFIERIVSSPTLVICGGGHVGVQLAKVAEIIGFQTIVIDERNEFANAERFPYAKSIINLPFNQALKEIDIPNAYYVIVTRGHQDDLLCLELILRKDFTYCGMIGSHKKVSIVLKELASRGFSSDLLSRIHAPIGLDISANTPEEIAVSIIAEIIQEKNNLLNCSEWSDSFIEDILRSTEPYAMVTLISKKGSSPRSPGARMIVHRDGSIISSIGGGYGEYEASMHALAMLKSSVKFHRYTCKMTNEEAANSGMVCGGTVDVFIEIVQE